MNDVGFRFGAATLVLAVLASSCVQGGGAPLEGTRWRLVQLGSVAQVATDPRNEPYLVFDAEAGRAAGSGGCNRITGPFERKGKTLRFGPIIATKMACATGMDTEQGFLQALESTRTWRIAGQHLELYGEDGSRVARLEASPEA